MKIKSFFLGSAAVLVAVSGARAADAVVMVEPEPAEYVRVCDAYGAGFFYIPGTETCLKFSGYVRGTYTGRSVTETAIKVAVPRLPGAIGRPTTSSLRNNVKTSDGRANYRGRLNVDARNETEWGTLRSQIRFQGSNGTYVKDDLFGDGNAIGHGYGDANVALARALVSLAGFRVGYSSDYWSTIGDYGYYAAINDGIYGDSSATFIDYTLAAEGFNLTVGAQTASGDRYGLYVDTTGTGKKPDLYVGATYGGSWGNVFGTYYYDSSVKKGAYKVGAELSLAEYIPNTAIKGWYMDDSGKTDYVGGNAWGVTAKVGLSDSWSIYGGYSRYRLKGDDAIYQVSNRQPFVVGASALELATDWTVGTKWEIVSGLSALFEYNNRKTRGVEVKSVLPDRYTGEAYERKSKSYVVRLVRTF